MGLHPFALPLVILLIVIINTSSNLILFSAQGRKLIETADISKRAVKEMMMRGEVGSRPPRCDRRCTSCAQCEAIQVPTNPPLPLIVNMSSNSTTISATLYERGDDTTSSNYKPMSWKCKCGDLIFTP